MVGRRVCSALLAQALVEGAEAPQLGPGVTACFGDVFDHATNQLVPFTYAACCVRNESCGFDDRFFSRSECCATGTVVLNPYAFTSPPTVVVPKPEAWPAREWPAKNHPSFAPEQRAWEAAINDAVRIREAHRNLVQTLVAQFGGEVVDVTGDESLSVFSSALRAVDCAMALQGALRSDPALRLRIGIHLGDVLRRNGEVIGEGVNVA